MILGFEKVSLDKLREHERNPRKHTQNQLEMLVNSIRKFGFNSPVIVTKDYEIIAGHARVAAAKEAGLKEVPCVVTDLEDKNALAYMIADNKHTDNSSWDFELLTEELEELLDEFSPDELGFLNDEVLFLLDQFLPKEEESIPEPENDILMATVTIRCKESQKEEIKKAIVDALEKLGEEYEYEIESK